MTTSQPSPNYRSHRTERRHIPPFGDGSAPNSVSNFLDGLLACKFAPFPNRALTSENRYDLTPDELGKSVAPRFEIAVAGADRLPNMLGAKVDDFELGVSVRSRHIRTYRVLGRWPLADASGKWTPDAAKLEDLQTGRDMDFVISVIVSADKPELAKLGMTPGKVIVRKELSVKEPKEPESSSFPFEWVEFGGDSGYPKESLWHIHWQDDAIDAESETPFAIPVEQALVVYMNKAAEPQLDALAQTKGAEGLAWRILAADITTQIWAVVLRETKIEPDGDDSDTLAGQVFARLSAISGKPYSDLRELLEDGRLSELRHMVARINGVVK